MDWLLKLFALFMLYSFLGWLFEIVVVYFYTKKIVNRGFLVGPVCPIYGCGCILIILLLEKYVHDPLALFVMSLFICSILEYFTSYVMEKLFKARWWDYSDKKININGRICLENCLAFGFLGLILVYFINPFCYGLIASLPKILLIVLDCILLILYIIDNAVSFKIIAGFKNVAKSINKDSTIEITNKVREKLMQRGGLYKRLVLAFNFSASENLLKEFSEKVSNTVRKVTNKKSK